jgi:hypothetical protein
LPYRPHHRHRRLRHCPYRAAAGTAVRYLGQGHLYFIQAWTPQPFVEDPADRERDRNDAYLQRKAVEREWLLARMGGSAISWSVTTRSNEANPPAPSPGSIRRASGVAWRSRSGQRPVVTGGRHEIMEALMDVLQALLEVPMEDVVKTLADVAQAFLVGRAMG